MRPPVDRGRVGAFLEALGRHASPGDRIYLSGGATAVSEGWRDSTLDIDIRIEAAGDDSSLYRAIAEIKESQDINIETAGPLDFIPEPPGWRDRSRYIGRFGNLDAFHTDFTLQALAKLERGLPTDRMDVEAMLARELTTGDQLSRDFASIRPLLIRFPGIEVRVFEAAVDGVVDRFDLQRFVDAQDRGGTYEQALAELRAGRKRGHWIWFVFPQIAGLGFSETSRRYSISSLEEAAAYLSHPLLGQRLVECCEALLAVRVSDPVSIFGDVDALKLRSSMTLFTRVENAPPLFADVLARYFGGLADEATERLLGGS